MRRTTAALLGGLTLAASALAPTTAHGASTLRLAPVLEASWEMNEPAGATTMDDSGPFALDGTITRTGVQTSDIQTGQDFGGGVIGYRWPRRPPTDPPVSPERVIIIPDNPHLDPLTSTFTVEIRYRTKEKFGNITQKGQATTRGGQFKIQNPQGRPSCLYTDSVGRRGAVRAPVALNDMAWHVLRCVKMPTAVELWVDGVRVGRKNGTIGNIDNSWEMTIGGKSRCDQGEVTCDYFSGDIDYVRVYRGS